MGSVWVDGAQNWRGGCRRHHHIWPCWLTHTLLSPPLRSDYPLDLRPLWLHARCYSSLEADGWSFATELPEWAVADWLPPALPPAQT